MAIINKVGVNALWNTTKKVAKHYEYMVVDPIYTDKVTQGFKRGKATTTVFKDAFELTKAKAKGRNVFSRVWDSLKGIGRDYKGIKAKVAGAGKLSFFKKVGKYLAPIGKRMPLIGNLMAVGFAIPTIISAFSNGGIGAGLKETAKEAFKLGAFTIGAAIGTAVFGPIGGIAGAMAAGWLAEKITGKTFSEKQDEAKGKTAEAPAQTEAPESNATAQAPTQQTEQSFEGQNNQTAYNNQGFNPYTYGQNFNPMAYGQGAYPQQGSNPFAGNDYMNEDLMAMGAFGRGQSYAR